jgi:CHAT domain-containing protein
MASLYRELGHQRKAIQHCRLALQDFDGIGMRVDVASCHMNIGNIYNERDEYDRAMADYNVALGVYDSKDMEADVATCYMNMASLYHKRGEYDQALEYYRLARSIFRKKAMKIDASRCDMNMAGVFWDLGQHHEALNLFKRVNIGCDHLPELKWKSLFGISRTYELMGDHAQARVLYKEAISVVDDLWSGVSQEELRTTFFSSVYDLYNKMIRLCLKQTDFESALEYVERAKNRNLSDLLAFRDLVPKNATAEERKEYQDLRFQMRACVAELRRVPDPEKSAVQRENLDKLETRHEEMVVKFRRNDPEFDPDLRLRVSYADVRDLAADCESTLVEFFPTEDGTEIFIIGYNGQCKMRVVHIDYSESELMRDVKELMNRYTAYVTQKDSQKKAQAKELWIECLEELLKDLYSKLFKEIRNYLTVGERIVFIPYAGFHLLPLHAMFTKDGGQKQYVIDNYTVSYAPSAKVLKQCRKRGRNREDNVLVAFANPRKKGKQKLRILHYARSEAEMIRNLFPGSLYLPVTTRSEMINKGKWANILHYTGHATFKSLILHDEMNKKQGKDFWTDDILVGLSLPNICLATLSACETGITRVGRVDEYLGLPSAFLCAGAPTVVSSLWSVEEVSTSLLMQKMYRLIKAGYAKAESLAKAQRWLKDPAKRQEHIALLPEWCKNGVDPDHILPADMSSPYYWAPFICSGVN